MKTRLFSLWLLLSVAVGLSAYDFMVDGLCYNITSSTAPYTVGVTYEQNPHLGIIGQPAYKSLTTANIPESVTYNNNVYRVTRIGDYAFQNCSYLTSVTIPSSVTSIGKFAFFNTGLKKVDYTGDIEGWLAINMGSNPISYSYNLYINNVLLTELIIPEGITHISSNFASCASLTSVTIPNSVTSIGDYAFSSCTGLTSITIPNSVTSIGKSAFSSCTGLTSVTIPNSVTSIGESAFSGCSGLTSVTIGNSVTSIGDYAFESCTGLTSVTIGKSVKSIGERIFSGCSSLTSVIWNAKACSDFKWYDTPFYYYDYKTEYLNFDIRPQITSFVFGDSAYIPDYLCSGMKNLTSVTISNSVTIGENAFSGCTGITSITIPNSEKGIENSAFSDCTGLTSVIIGNASIGENAFSGCKNVETVVFGSAVETIGASAFAGCQSIYEMTIYATKVPTIQENTFTEVGTGATLRVPAGCAKKYKAHPYWGVFNIEEIPSEYIITVTCDPKQGQVSGSGTFTDGSEVTITATPNEGYEFTQWSDGNKDNPRKVTVTADATYTAEFALQNYVVSVTCDPQQGQVTGDGTYPYGSEVTLTATANEGYEFTQWSDGNKDNPRKVTVTADATYTAEFALLNYVVTATCDPQQGQVTGGGTYPYGSEVTLTATPNEGYAFTQWSDGNKDNPRKVTVTTDATYTAEFALQTYVVSVTCDPQQGQVTGGGTYTYGSEVTLTAVPNDGYTFKQWSDGTLANPYSFPAEKDVNIEALFEPTTPVENVAAEENDAPRKVFRNGQVYILRNGKTYTLTGVEVK